VHVIDTAGFTGNPLKRFDAQQVAAVLFEPSAEEILEALFGQNAAENAAVILVPQTLKRARIDFGEVPISSDGLGPVLGLFTSGTTGEPKLHFHTLRSLLRGSSPGHRGKVWGMLYQSTRMAGIQVLLQAFSSKSQLVEPTNVSDLDRTVNEFVKAGVDSLSSTPSGWRMILATKNFRELNLQFISMGGEIATQQLLSDLVSAFPQAEVRHIYATTETGPVFSVPDGLEGFPEDYLNRNHASGRVVRLESGELMISSVDSGAQSNRLFATGDLVEVVNGRVLFAGRRDDLINIGGNKISLMKVENAVQSLPEVLQCVAYSIPNPFLGSVVGVKVLWRQPPLTDSGLRAALIHQLPKYALPAVVISVDRMELTDNFKKMRKL